MIGLADRTISPQDCLLVIGLPLDEDAFMRSLECESTYANSYLENPSDKANAWAAYDRFLTQCKQAIARVEQLGGRVFLPINPEDLAAASAEFTMIAIFTHSKWRPFDVTQVRDAFGLVESLMFGSSLASETFRAWFGNLESKVPDAGESPCQTILEALAAASRFSHDWWAARPSKRNASIMGSLESAVADNLCRPEIDRQFAEHIHCDKGIELGGRMYGLAEVFQRLGGVEKKHIFDLRMCNSGMVMNSVKALHPDSLVVVNQWLADPTSGMLRYTAILQDLRNRKCSYISSCERINLWSITKSQEL